MKQIPPLGTVLTNVCLTRLQIQRLNVAWNESSFEQKECKWF